LNQSKVSIVSILLMELRILQKADTMFLRYGLRSVTMDDIAKELGISKKTIYLYFADKDALIDKVTEYMLQEEKNKAEEIYKISKNPIEEIFLSTKIMKEMLQNINVVLFYDMQKYYPSSWQKYCDFKVYFLEIVKRNLQEGITQKLYRAEINIDILAKTRIETVDMGFNMELFPAVKFNLYDFQLENIDHYIRGIVTPHGLEVYEKTKLKI
jgi:TetR/AcrR family transcriptional regulator, cholesterol catabolism regulator